MGEPAMLRIRGLRAGYGRHAVLEGIDLDIHAGRLTGLIGPNGGGKSTLLRAILGETRLSGHVAVQGRPLEDLRQIAYVPQRGGIDFTFPITVEEVALQGTYARLPWWRRAGREQRESARESLEAVDMVHYSRRPIGELSGGQAARVFLARALAQHPAVFLLDEPFAAVDVASERKILDALRARARAGDVVLIVHHNLERVPAYFDDLIVLNNAVVAAGAVTDVFTPTVLGEAFPAASALARLGDERQWEGT